MIGTFLSPFPPTIVSYFLLYFSAEGKRHSHLPAFVFPSVLVFQSHDSCGDRNYESTLLRGSLLVLLLSDRLYPSKSLADLLPIAFHAFLPIRGINVEFSKMIWRFPFLSPLALLGPLESRYRQQMDILRYFSHAVIKCVPFLLPKPLGLSRSLSSHSRFTQLSSMGLYVESAPPFEFASYLLGVRSPFLLTGFSPDVSAALQEEGVDPRSPTPVTSGGSRRPLD